MEPCFESYILCWYKHLYFCVFFLFAALAFHLPFDADHYSLSMYSCLAIDFDRKQRNTMSWRYCGTERNKTKTHSHQHKSENEWPNAWNFMCQPDANLNASLKHLFWFLRWMKYNMFSCHIITHIQSIIMDFVGWKRGYGLRKIKHFECKSSKKQQPFTMLQLEIGQSNQHACKCKNKM